MNAIDVAVHVISVTGVLEKDSITLLLGPAKSDVSSEHRVTVLEKGFEYRGEPYRSLSQVARRITGSRWSGPAFFGLKRRREAKA